MTKKQKYEKARYKEDAHNHALRRLHERYPHLNGKVKLDDLRKSRKLKLFPTKGSTRIVTVVCIEKELIYFVYTISTKMIHTVLTKDMVQELIDNYDLGIDLTEALIKEGIDSKFRTYKTFMGEREIYDSIEGDFYDRV